MLLNPMWSSQLKSVYMRFHFGRNEIFSIRCLVNLLQLFTWNILSWKTVAKRCSVKKKFLEISQNSQENTCARVAYCILQNISHAKYSCEIFRNLPHDYVNCCFDIRLWFFAHKRRQRKKIIVISLIWLQKKWGVLVFWKVFWLRNTDLKILELFCN